MYLVKKLRCIGGSGSRLVATPLNKLQRANPSIAEEMDSPCSFWSLRMSSEYFDTGGVGYILNVIFVKYWISNRSKNQIINLFLGHLVKGLVLGNYPKITVQTPEQNICDPEDQKGRFQSIPKRFEGVVMPSEIR